MKKLLLIFILIFAAISVKAEEAPVEIFSKELKKMSANYDMELAKKRPVLELVKTVKEQREESKATISQLNVEEKTAESCETFYETRKDDFVAMSSAAQHLIGENYNQCDMLKILKEAQAYKKDKDFFTGDIAKLVFEKFDVNSIYTSLRHKEKSGPDFLAKLTERAHDLYKYDLDTNNVNIEYRGHDQWHYQINILAKGDFNDDGYSDVLIEFLDEAKSKANYYSRNVYILTRKDANESIIAQEPKT